MPQNESLTITFTGADSNTGLSGDAWIRLEQPDWPYQGADGFATYLLEHGVKAAGGSTDLSDMMNYWEDFQSECQSNENGCIETEIWVHKSPADLQYRLEASWGELGPRMQEETEHVESVQINLVDSYEFYQANVTRIVSMAWEGSVYAEDGSQVHKMPSASYVGGVITFPFKVFGILRITYRMGYDKYALKITPRNEGEYDTQDKSAAYQSTVMAFYNTKVETLDVSLPDLSSSACGGEWATATTVNEDDEDEGDCYKLMLKVHKCTGEEISRELVRVPCPKSA